MSSCENPPIIRLSNIGSFDTTALRHVAIGDSGFVFDPISGQTFNVNSTGLAVLRALNDGATAKEIVALLCDRYTCEVKDDPRGDAEDFLAQLAGFGLITAPARS